MNEYNKEVGDYIEQKMDEREDYLRASGKIKTSRKLSKNYMAREVLNVSATWFNSVVSGDKRAGDDMLLKIARYLELDEDEIFKVARRIHPDVLEECKKSYLGEYYEENQSSI